MSALSFSRQARLALGGLGLLAIGAAGGAGVVSATRSPVEMAPAVITPISRLAMSNGIVTVRGRIAERFGDRVVLQDATGRTMIDAGRQPGDAIAVGSSMSAQGRYADGQLRADYLVDGAGTVFAVGRMGRRSHGRDGRSPHGPADRGDTEDQPDNPHGCRLSAPTTRPDGRVQS